MLNPTSLPVLRENQQLNSSTKYPECLRGMKPESWSQVRKKRLKNMVAVREKRKEGGKDRVVHLNGETSVGLAVSRRKEFCCNLCDKYENHFFPCYIILTKRLLLKYRILMWSYITVHGMHYSLKECYYMINGRKVKKQHLFEMESFCNIINVTFAE